MVGNAAALLLSGVLAAVMSIGATPAIGGGAADPIQEVVGGQLASDGDFPWMVRLSMGCGGALTAPRVVLTAGHCVNGTGPESGIQVLAGTADLTARGAVVAHSVSVFRAEGFRGEIYGADWALVELDRDLGLPTLPVARSVVGARAKVTLLGWGQTSEKGLEQQDRLRYGTVPVVSDSACAQAYRPFGVRLVPAESICAGDKVVDACQGDSGGPMVRRDATGRWVQVGIVSWGLGCARDGYPGVYTQLSTFRTAIRAATRKLS
jgi:secreted trypsin-like serine protease